MTPSNNDLINNYKVCSNFLYKNNPDSRHRSRHWSYFYQLNIDEESLKNFRYKKKISLGLDDQTESFDFKIFAKIVNEISEDYVLRNLPKKNVGNCDTLLSYKNNLIDYNKLIHIHWFHTIEKEILEQNKVQNICEIGGGFGSFSELFIKNYNTKLISIDLPEANLMTSYYLKENFPSKKFYLFENYLENEILSFDAFQNNDVIILPPNCKFDKRIKIDMFINTRSMMEMKKVVIKSYFDFIHSHSHQNSLFLNINRYEKNSSGDLILLHEYPYDKKWRKIISKPSFNQEWVHFLVTQRCEDDSKANINATLKEIEQIGRKFYGLYIDKIPYFFGVKTIERINLIIKKILKKILGKKFLNKIGNLLSKWGRMFQNIK
tara:strand:- start:809 stop:1939 length:1131 start_codon:yes stop_codon:yes gene_type:complete